MGEVTGFTNLYTTEALLLADSKKEKDKTVLSNDAYAIGRLLECLINKITR